MKLLYSLIFSALIIHSAQATMVDALREASTWLYVRLGIITQKEVAQQTKNVEQKLKTKIEALNTHILKLQNECETQFKENAQSNKKKYRILDGILTENRAAMKALQENLDDLCNMREEDRRDIEKEVAKLCEINRRFSKLEERNIHLATTLKTRLSFFDDETPQSLIKRTEKIETDIEALHERATRFEIELLLTKEELKKALSVSERIMAAVIKDRNEQKVSRLYPIISKSKECDFDPLMS